MKTQATVASKSNRTAEAKQAKEAVVFMSKQYDDLEVFRKQATQDILQITKNWILPVKNAMRLRRTI